MTKRISESDYINDESNSLTAEQISWLKVPRACACLGSPKNVDTNRCYCNLQAVAVDEAERKLRTFTERVRAAREQGIES